MPSPVDSRAIEVIERCEATLRALTAMPTGPRPDAMRTLAQQRLALVGGMAGLRAQAKVVDQRIDKATRAVLALSQSDRDRMLIAEAILDLSQGRKPTRPVPPRIEKREEYRDVVEAHALQRALVDKRATIEAQIDGIDATFSALGAEPPSAPTPDGPAPAAGPVNPTIW